MPPQETDRHREFLRCFTTNEAAIRAYVRRLVPLRADADDVMQFRDVGVDIGLEYVDPKYKILPTQGPGKGRTVLAFGIWKREVQQPGEVKLGPPYSEKFRDASEVRPNFMYGIAAKALPK